jgi:hypothetical protein
MAAIGQKIIPHKGIDLDSAELYIEEAKAVLLKNITYAVNDNERVSLDEGANKFVFTPLEANSKYCSMSLPAGNNYVIGFFYSKEIKKAFVFVWNSGANHLIYQLDATNGQCQKIAQTACFNFQLDPRHFIAEGRCYAFVTTYFNKSSQTYQTRTQLIFTDNYIDNDVRSLFVEDCIATSFFDPSLFEFFNINDTDCYRCNLINLGLPEPVGCIQITPISRDTTDLDEMNLVNRVLNNPWRFRIKYVDVWGRESEWGDVSEMYIPQVGSNCAASTNARCLKLKFNAGCPTIRQIIVAFSNWTGNVRGFSTESDWYRCAIITKYNECENVEWWEQTINDGITYNSVDNTIEYTFCADGEKVAIDVDETNRLNNPLPLRSSSVFPVGKSVALARNTRDFEPMNCDELDKITFPVTPPADNSVCKPDARELTMYAVIWNPFEDQAVPIRKKDDNLVFGVPDCGNNNPVVYKQVFPKDQKGFIGCLRGTKHWVISIQCRYDKITGLVEEVGVPYSNNNDFTGRYVPVQKFVFKNVVPGRYVFQISSHQASPTDDFQKLSTYTRGRTSILNVGQLVNSQKEIVINSCGGDVTELSSPLMIYDLTRIGKGCAVVDATSVNNGYLYEDEKEGRPIELARVDPDEDGFDSGTTDHNGFFFSASRKRGLQTSLFGYKNCVANSFLAKGSRSLDTADNWYKFDKLYAYTGTNLYLTKDRMLIKGKVCLCSDNSIGVQGVLVLLTRGGYAITNADGEYTIAAHDIGGGGTRTDTVIFSQQGSCHILACSGTCNYCLPTQPFTSVTCSGSVRTINMADQGCTVNGAGKKGPKMGGRKGMGTVLYDWMGRKTYTQVRPSHYVDFPTLQQTQTFDYSSFGFNLNGCQFPPWVKRIGFYITEDLLLDEWEVWVAERVQYIDNTGKTNNTAPTQIRLYYESLNEYNKQNNFSTNTLWQFIDDEDKTILGDYVEFLAHADGTIFPTRITALVKHNKDGKYFLIDYSDELVGLKDGTLIQFCRPKPFQNEEFYYSLCPIIKVLDGQAVQQSGTFNFFDSYLFGRQIPVPVEESKPNDDGEIVTTTDVQLKNYPFYFEHHSPSDFWGDHAWSKGRISTRNRYEHQQTKLMEVAVSKALANNGVINNLHYFDTEDIKEFDGQFGGIVVGIAQKNIVLFICENNNFVSIYNDAAVEVRDGQVIAPNAEDKFGRPQSKLGNDFGCQMIDINTIRERNGIVIFLDQSKNALVLHNYSDATDVSVADVKSWLTSKIKHIRNFNLSSETSGLKYFHGGIDPKTNQYILTDSIIEARTIEEGDVDYACPEGYELSDDGTTCTWIEEAPPESQEEPVHAAISQNGVYSQYGMRVYDSGFNGSGNGPATEVLYPNSFWSNFDGSDTAGPMNRNGIWVDNNNDGIRDPLTAGAQLTITFALNSSSQRVLYFGIGGDNKIKLVVNGVVIVSKQIIDPDNFKWWHVYPVLVNAGANLVSLTGEGDGSIQDSMAMEIYDNTPEEIAAALDYTDLTVLFKTEDLRGGVLQITNCAEGFQPVNTGGNWVCQKVHTVPSVPIDTPVDVVLDKFINNLPAPDVTTGETIVFDIDAKRFVEMRSYVPEYYGHMEDDIFGAQLISFRIGEAWKHHKLIDPGTVFLNFYGTTVDAYVEVVFNLDNTKVKNFLYNEVYCKQVQFYCDRILTESGQTSRLMPLWWEKRDKFWAADFKCALNTPTDTMLSQDTGAGALLDGDPLYGRWLKARYKVKSADRNKYWELTSIIGYMNGAEKSSDK